MLRAAAAAAAAQQYPPGTLYVVATPIGNLADLSLRAVHVLGIVEAVACEDTRKTGTLLNHLGLSRPLLAVHAHNEAQAARLVCARLAAGESVAFASDAGTPAISDPGARLVASVRAAGHRIVPLPGASSAAAALSVAGDVHGEGFCFHGFLPARGAARQAALQRLLAAPTGQTQVLFEAPHRIATLAAELQARADARAITICRELTKQFEEVASLPAAELPAWLAAEPHRGRGEFVVVLHAQPPAPASEQAVPPEAQQALRLLLEELPLKRAVALAARLTGASRNALYEQALSMRQACAGEAARPDET